MIHPDIWRSLDVFDNIKSSIDPSSVGGYGYGAWGELHSTPIPSEGGYQLLGDLHLGSRISSILPHEEEGTCILGWRVREHSDSSGCMFVLQYDVAIMGPALVSDDSHPRSQYKQL